MRLIMIHKSNRFSLHAVILFIEFRARITSKLFFAYNADVFLDSDGLWQETKLPIRDIGGLGLYRNSGRDVWATHRVGDVTALSVWRASPISITSLGRTHDVMATEIRFKEIPRRKRPRHVEDTPPSSSSPLPPPQRGFTSPIRPPT